MNELSTFKGRYEPGEPIKLHLIHQTPADHLKWSLFHLEKELQQGTEPISGCDFCFCLPPLQAGGYGVEITLCTKEHSLGCLQTAVNVGGSVVRYGFLSDFLPEDDRDVEALAKYHIDHVQFYDWSWRHDTLVAPSDQYQDMMGKKNQLSVIRQKIAACHERGMLAMAYGAVYAASRSFWEQHRDWGLYSATDHPMTFIDTFYYMDLESPWRLRLMEQYRSAITQCGFDGIHMDTYGEPKKAHNVWGEHRCLEQEFAPLIEDTGAFLRDSGITTPHLIFNNVGTWPVEKTRDASQDAVYMELWAPMDRYRHLRQAAQLSENRPCVLAAYPAPFRTDTPERALYSELFLSFAIALLGATQLFLGENNAVVTQGYYADYSLLNPDQQKWIKRYQDFFVRYEELLYNSTMRDVTWTHCGGDNLEYRFEFPFSVDGEAEKIWLTLRENESYKLIGLINLCGNDDDHWNAGKDAPVEQRSLTVHVLADSPCGVWYASPDMENGHSLPLTFKNCNTNLGNEITFVVPKLINCGVVWIEL